MNILVRERRYESGDKKQLNDDYISFLVCRNKHPHWLTTAQVLIWKPEV
jgi:hypothetical protein